MYHKPSSVRAAAARPRHTYPASRRRPLFASAWNRREQSRFPRVACRLQATGCFYLHSCRPTRLPLLAGSTCYFRRQSSTAGSVLASRPQVTSPPSLWLAASCEHPPPAGLHFHVLYPGSPSVSRPSLPLNRSVSGRTTARLSRRRHRGWPPLRLSHKPHLLYQGLPAYEFASAGVKGVKYKKEVVDGFHDVLDLETLNIELRI